MDCGVQILVFITAALIYILNRNGMSQLVISQKSPVPVVNASPASFNGALLPDLHLKGIQILLPMNDLKVENPIDHDTADTTHEDNQEKGP